MSWALALLDFIPEEYLDEVRATVEDVDRVFEVARRISMRSWLIIRLSYPGRFPTQCLEGHFVEVAKIGSEGADSAGIKSSVLTSVL
jgi:hypothetical protein